MDDIIVFDFWMSYYRNNFVEGAIREEPAKSGTLLGFFSNTFTVYLQQNIYYFDDFKGTFINLCKFILRPIKLQDNNNGKRLEGGLNR